MRILHIVGSISPEAGGPTEAIRLLVQNAPSDTTAEVASLDAPDEPFLATLPFSIHALGMKSGKHRKGSQWYAPLLLPWLRANRARFDRVIVHGLWEYAGLAVRLSGIPYATFPHGMLDPFFRRKSPLKHLKKQLYWLLVESWNLRSAHCVLFTTETEATLAKRSFWPARWRQQIAALGAGRPPEETASTVRAFHRHCPAVANKRFLLFLGRLDPKKGLDLLLEAFSGAEAVAVTDPELHLVIAGPDPTGWGDGLRIRAANSGFGHRIHFVGMLQGSVKWGALMACEAFVLPSHQENFGIAVAEALASGRPVLLSDQVNIAAEVATAHCGLVEPDTLAGTRALLTRWIGLSEGERSMMGLLACACFMARYDMARNTEAIVRVFEDEASLLPQATLTEAQP